MFSCIKVPWKINIKITNGVQLRRIIREGQVRMEMSGEIVKVTNSLLVEACEKLPMYMK